MNLQSSRYNKRIDVKACYATRITNVVYKQIEKLVDTIVKHTHSYSIWKLNFKNKFPQTIATVTTVGIRGSCGTFLRETFINVEDSSRYDSSYVKNKMDRCFPSIQIRTFAFGLSFYHTVFL